MKSHRFLSSFLAAFAVLACAAANLAAAQTPAFPTKPLKIVVPFGAGGVADLTARTVAAKLAENLGQAVVVENRPGAGGVVAGDVVAKAEPDGHTLLLMSNGTAVSAGLFKALPFDALQDFAPVSTLGFFDIAVLANEGGRFKNFAEVLSHARANPGKLNIGSINIGSTQNLAAELLKSSAGFEAQVVPFNGTPAVVTALRSGQIDVAVEILGPVMGQVKGNALRVLAVMGDKRNGALPDVPTVREGGVAGFQVASWNALAAPAKTPPAVIARLNRAVQAALSAPETQKRLSDLNVEAKASTPRELHDLLASETKRWAEVIERAKVPKQ